MTDVVDTPEVVDAPAPSDTPEVKTYSDVEQKAIDQGWRPKEEWAGDPEQWRGAKEFVERGELFGKMDTMGRELKETRKALKMLQDHHLKLKDTEYNRALDELKLAQKKHLTEGNSDAYLEVTETLTDLKAEQKAREVLQQQQASQPDPRFVSWVQANKWYEQDVSMRSYADTLGQNYAKANPGINPVEVLEFVAKEVKTRFKEKFENPNRTKPNSVEGGGAPRATSKKNDIELSDDERRVMNTFIRQNIMTKDEYLDELRKVRGMK